MTRDKDVEELVEFWERQSERKGISEEGKVWINFFLEDLKGLLE